MKRKQQQPQTPVSTEIAQPVATDLPTEPVSAPASAPAPMRVRATQLGFYSMRRRRVGDVFTLRQPSDFSPVWMVRADDAPETETTVRDAQRKQHAAILSGIELQPNAADPVEDDEDDDEGPTGDREVI